MEKSLKEPGKLRQFLATMSVNLSTLSYGLMIGWQSPSAPQLQSPSPPVGNEPMTDYDVSWLSAIMCLLGGLTTAVLSVIPDRFSRKRFGYALILPLTLSWLLIAFATEHTHIYLARALSGVAGACIFFLTANYVSEITCDSIRGILASFVPLAINVGILLAYSLGSVMSIRAFAAASAALSALYLITFVFIPESPVYLIRQNRIHDAVRSLKWLKHGNNLVVEQTLSNLQLEVKEAASKKSVKLSDLFRDKATIKGVIIILGLFAGQQLCGIFAMLSYTETIFKMSGSSLSPSASSIIIAVIQVIGTVLSLFLVERTGRRPLLLVSNGSMCVCLCVMGIFFYLQDSQYDMSAYGWIPVVTLSIFIIIYATGMGSGPFVVMSEILSRDVTSLGTIMGLSMCWIASFIMVKTFADLIVLLGMHGCFFLFATSCACTFLFCFVLVPETKGRTREDIVNELNGVLYMKNEKNIKHIMKTDSTHATNV